MKRRKIVCINNKGFDAVLEDGGWYIVSRRKSCGCEKNNQWVSVIRTKGPVRMGVVGRGVNTMTVCPLCGLNIDDGALYFNMVRFANGDDWIEAEAAVFDMIHSLTGITFDKNET